MKSTSHSRATTSAARATTASFEPASWTPKTSSHLWRRRRAHSELCPCNSFSASAISPTVMSTPRPLQTCRNGKFPFVVRGASTSLPFTSTFRFSRSPKAPANFSGASSCNRFVTVSARGVRTCRFRSDLRSSKFKKLTWSTCPAGVANRLVNVPGCSCSSAPPAFLLALSVCVGSSVAEFKINTLAEPVKCLKNASVYKATPSVSINGTPSSPRTTRRQCSFRTGASRSRVPRSGSCGFAGSVTSEAEGTTSGSRVRRAWCSLSFIDRVGTPLAWAVQVSSSTATRGLFKAGAPDKSRCGGS